MSKELINYEVKSPIPAKLELDNFGVELTSEDKLNVLDVLIMDVEDSLLKVTNKEQRIPRLAKMQVLQECKEIMKYYYAIERSKNNE